MILFMSFLFNFVTKMGMKIEIMYYADNSAKKCHILVQGQKTVRKKVTVFRQ